MQFCVSLRLRAVSRQISILQKERESENVNLFYIYRFDVELRSPVTKAMLGAMAKTADAVSASRLRQYISREGKDFFTQLLQKQVTFIDMVKAFPVWFNINKSILYAIK